MNLLRCCVAAKSFTGLALVSQTVLAQSLEAVRLQCTSPGQDLSLLGFVVLSCPAYSGGGERRLHADLFGIDASQAARSGYAAYTPGSGLRDARASVSLLYGIDPRSAFTAATEFNRLLGDAADIPLTRQRNIASAAPVYTYAF